MLALNEHWYPAKKMLGKNHLSSSCPGAFGSNTTVGKDNRQVRATWNNSASYCRRKSKQALRDYKKVQIQLENLETSVRDRCKKEFTGQSLSSWVLAASGKLGDPLSALPLFPFLHTHLGSSEDAVTLSCASALKCIAKFFHFEFFSLIQSTVISTEPSDSPVYPSDSDEELKVKRAAHLERS